MEIIILLWKGFLSTVRSWGYPLKTPTRRGITDANGTFLYQAGEEVSFSIGGVYLGRSSGKKTITPVDLVPNAADETDLSVTNISRLLLSLDEDCNPANGIAIPSAIIDEIRGETFDFASSLDAFERNSASFFARVNTSNLFACGNVSLYSVEEARRHLRTTIRGMPQYKLTIKAGNNSAVVADPLRDFYDSGEQVTLTAVMNSGWKFQNWLGDISTYENPVTITMNADKTAVAVPTMVNQESFQVPQVLRLTEVGSGTVDINPPGGVYHGEPHGYITKNIVVTLTAKPGPGWVLTIGR